MKSLHWVVLFFLGVLVASCSDDYVPRGVERIDYNNIILLADVSKRVDGHSDLDTAIINRIVDFFVTDCVKPGMKINDRSGILFMRANAQKSVCESARINLRDIKSLEEKQAFVNDKVSSGGLSFAVDQFKESVECVYNERDRGGLDLLSLVCEAIDNETNIRLPEYLYGEGDSTLLFYHNHVVVFTDGYLEGNRNSDKRFYFDRQNIQRLREFCGQRGVTVKQAIALDPTLGLPVAPPSEMYKHVTLHVMETLDRSFIAENGTFRTMENKPMNDNKILEEVWREWANQSGFAGFHWYPKFKVPPSHEDLKRMLEHARSHPG